MKLLQSAVLLMGAGFWLASETAFAQLSVGDAAPPLQVGQWVQGEPVTAFDTNHIYIIEFWATWCVPCRLAIPHLNELAGKFKDKGVIVIGQNTRDRDAAVAPFVKKMGDQMTYRVTLDNKSQETNGFMYVNWYKRSNSPGIPDAFVVNQQGIIAWIGDPATLKDQVINDILSGHYDLTKAAADYKQKQLLDKKCHEIDGRLSTAVKQTNWDNASAVLDELIQTDPTLKHDYANVRFQIILGQKKYAEAYQLADALNDEQPPDAALLNSLSWIITTQPGVEQRDLDRAQKFAEHADQVAAGKDAGILDTLARAQFMGGNKSAALVTEQKALDAAPDGQKDLFQKVLTSYQQDHLPEITH